MLKIITFILSSSISCHAPIGSKNENSSVQGIASEKYRNAFANLQGTFTIGEPESIEKLNRLSDFDRAVLTVSADRAATTQLDKNWEVRKIPYVPVTTEKIGYKVTLQKYDNPPPSEGRLASLANTFSLQDGQCSLIIPFHPDTKNKPPLVAKLLENSSQKELELDAFNSMSRSLFVINYKSAPLLYSVKMGTDFIRSVRPILASQPSKLLGIQEHVARVNRFGESTSILSLAHEEGILMLNDSVGINFFEKGAQADDDAKNNGMIIRNYDAVLADKDRIYLPLDKFLHPMATLDSRSLRILAWRLHHSILGKILLKFEIKDLDRMVSHLAVQYGKLMAIYYLNGYTSRDLHGQNVLVGVPLKKDLKPILAVRDLSDHAPLPFSVGGSRSKVLSPIPEIDWNKILFNEYDFTVNRKNLQIEPSIENLVLNGFRSVEKRLMADLKNNSPILVPQAKHYRELYEALDRDSFPTMLEFVNKVRNYGSEKKN